MPEPTAAEVLAVGAWLKNSACRWAPATFGAAPRLRSSALHGDLATPEACTALEASCEALLAEAPERIGAVAHDLHPDFFSTRLAQRLAARLGVPAIGVQHHHAHIEAVRAEHGVSAPVIGLALDGVGLGSDGQAWGGELLRVADDDWQRLGHLAPLALPGGDVAAREPWRLAAAVLHALGRGAEIVPRFAPAVGLPMASGVATMLARGLNCPPSSSAGRWFDAAAGALGLSLRQAAEAEAAMALEQRATRWLACHPAPVRMQRVQRHADGVIDLLPLLQSLLDTPQFDDAIDAAAAHFHLALADALTDAACAAAQAQGITTICLGGGCFFNTVLRERITSQLQAAGLQVLRPLQHSCGDAGLALGQASVAAHRLRVAGHSIHAKEGLPCA